jgi:CheY-like chemotaxis protein
VQLANISSAGERAAQLTGQLLAFARKQVFQLQVIEPGVLLTDLEQLLRRLIGEDIELRTRIGAGLWPLRIDPHQIGQVVLNLAVNARDAMPSGGILTLEAENVTLNGDYARERPEVAPGDYVMLAVSDTGVGMEASMQEHVFEPFFTTKTQGTGLGLATSYGIVKQHGGHVWIYSEPGKGSMFKVYLPRAGAGDAAAPQPSPRAKSVAGGSETVLLVEDEPQVRAMAERGLRAFGFVVLAAANGDDALALAAAHPGAIHAVVTDVVMPNMSGRELAEVLAEVRPEARILFVSGYTEAVINRHRDLGGDAAFLQKPFTPSSLAQRLRDLLDAE